MAENSKITTISSQETDFKSSQSEEFEKTSLFPRSAWNSQLTYLKLLLKTKQVLDKG